MMSADICVCCGEIVPEGQMICWKCEHADNIADEEVKDTYEWLYADIEDAIDMS